MALALTATGTAACSSTPPPLAISTQGVPSDARIGHLTCVAKGLVVRATGTVTALGTDRALLLQPTVSVGVLNLAGDQIGSTPGQPLAVSVGRPSTFSYVIPLPAKAVPAACVVGWHTNPPTGGDGTN